MRCSCSCLFLIAWAQLLAFSPSHFLHCLYREHVWWLPLVPLFFSFFPLCFHSFVAGDTHLAGIGIGIVELYI